MATINCAIAMFGGDYRSNEIRKAMVKAISINSEDKSFEPTIAGIEEKYGKHYQDYIKGNELLKLIILWFPAAKKPREFLISSAIWIAFSGKIGVIFHDSVFEFRSPPCCLNKCRFSK
jgi:hypothetical protein